MSTEHHRFKAGRAWVDITVAGDLGHRGRAKLRAYLDLAFADLAEDAADDARLDAGSAMELAARERAWLLTRASEAAGS